MKPIFLLVCLLCTFKVLAQDHNFKSDTAQEKMDLTPPEVYTYVEQLPGPGYDMAKYLSEHLNYPDIAYKANIQGRVILKFIINEDGSASDFKVEKGIGGGCDEEAIRVLRAMPQWKAGMHNGLPVRVWTMLPVSFNLSQNSSIAKKSECTNDMRTYISRNLHYPDSARENNISGRVIIKFLVNEEGTIDSVTVLKGIGYGCDEEAVRVIKEMPRWKPAMKDGKPVKLWLTQPFTFGIDDGSNNNKRKKKSSQ